MLLSLLPLTVARVEEMSDKLGFQQAWCMKPPKGKQPQPQLTLADGLAPVPGPTHPPVPLTLVDPVPGHTQTMPATEPVTLPKSAPVPDHMQPQTMPATQPVPIAAATPVMHMEITLL